MVLFPRQAWKVHHQLLVHVLWIMGHIMSIISLYQSTHLSSVIIVYIISVVYSVLAMRFCSDVMINFLQKETWNSVGFHRVCICLKWETIPPCSDCSAWTLFSYQILAWTVINCIVFWHVKYSIIIKGKSWYCLCVTICYSAKHWSNWRQPQSKLAALTAGRVSNKS